MRIAVITDIHGNMPAFDAVLADLEHWHVDQSICLGDALQGGPFPAEVAAKLHELGWPVVLGNADHFMATGDDGPFEPTDEQLRVAEWSMAQLGEHGVEVLRSFQPTVTVELPGDRRLLGFHATPTSMYDIIIPQTGHGQVLEWLDPRRQAFMCGGHTHVQQLRRLGTDLFFNPGSVSLPTDIYQVAEPRKADPWAEYAILTVDEQSEGIEFRAVGYDIDAYFAAARATSHPAIDSVIDRYRRPS